MLKKILDTYLAGGASSGMRTSTTGTVAGTGAWGLKVPEWFTVGIALLTSLPQVAILIFIWGALRNVLPVDIVKKENRIVLIYMTKSDNLKIHRFIIYEEQTKFGT